MLGLGFRVGSRGGRRERAEGKSEREREMGTSPRGLIPSRRQASRRWRGGVGFVLLAAKEEEKKEKEIFQITPGLACNY